ncbi:MAG: glycoside hydrolase family 36 protein [Deltaproteobacteria bacterium]|nr:glycoside hydrolase family 36 protein [Deltaproteobacteria bacterium]
MKIPPDPPFSKGGTIDLVDGRLQIRGAGLALVDLTVGLTIERDGERLRWRAEALTAAESGWQASWAELGVRMELRAEAGDEALRLHATLIHDGEAELRLIEVALLEGAAGAGDWAVFRNGYQSWSGTRVYAATDADADPWWSFLRDVQTDAAHVAVARPGVFRSDLVSVLVERGSGAALGLGVLETATYVAAVEADVSGGTARRVAVVLDGDRTPLRPGERRPLPALWVATGDDGWTLLEDWASACGAAMRARLPARTPLGWCSWYYYFTRVTEADVIGNLDRLTRLRGRVGCDYVQVDDGYQRAIGDWFEPNGKFPHGMRWLAERIRAAGFDAGIWVAPFLVRPDARLFRERPQWLLRTARGAPRAACWNPGWSLGWPAYALDTTHPEVLDWLRELGRTLAGQWGYRILKLDFLYAAALPGVRHDATATRAQALRRGLEAIREGAGDDAFLLGCGCPLGPAVGVVDGMRIGADVAPFWDNWISRGPNRRRHGVATAHAMQNILTRAFMHRRLWLNDPDCLMVRAAETQLTPDEVRSLATAIALTDGMFVLSDRLEALPEERLGWIERMLPLLGGRPRVEDAFARAMPEQLTAAYADGDAIAVFNFGARPADRQVTVPAPVSHVRELWSEAELPVRDGRVSLPAIPPHGVRLLWIDRPAPVVEDQP